MTDKVIKTIEENSLIKKGSCVIIAVSGGADSMALMYLLNSLKREYDLTLTVAHVNHGIRGEEAERDEKFVEKHAQKLGIAFKCLHADVPSLAEQSGESVEECGRRVRYEFFRSIDENALVATAHTLSDNAETMLLNLARGATLKGLCAIPVKRGNIVRPLLNCTRAEIEGYCCANGIDYVTDSTNLCDEYSRNIIRHKVIPVLKQLNPSFEKSVLRCVTSLTRDERFISASAREAYGKVKLENGYDAEGLKAYPDSLRKRVIALILKENTGVLPEMKHIDAVDEILCGGSTQVLKAVNVRVRKGVLDFPNFGNDPGEWSFELNGTAETPAGTVKSEIIYKKDSVSSKKIQKDLLDIYIDCDRIIGTVTVRGRLGGDKLRPVRRNCTVSLKKLFNEKGIAPEKRAFVPIICDDKGILAVGGLAVDERAAVSGLTEKILHITVENKRSQDYERGY